jgi:hypothetical protein
MFSVRRKRIRMSEFDQTNMISGRDPSRTERIIDNCVYCPGTLFKDTHPNKCYNYFHQPCLLPRCSQFDAINTSLCSFCRHARLWHVTLCKGCKNVCHPDDLSFDLWAMLSGNNFKNSTCSFCNVIEYIIASAYGQSYVLVDEQYRYRLLLKKQENHVIAQIFECSDKGFSQKSIFIGSFIIEETDDGMYRRLYVCRLLIWVRIPKTAYW